MARWSDGSEGHKQTSQKRLSPLLLRKLSSGMSCSSRSSVGLGLVYQTADVAASSSGSNVRPSGCDLTPEMTPSESRVKRLSVPDASLTRHGTLLSSGATPARRATELKSLLGNANSRLRPGALTSQLPEREPTVLEQAKPRARVEVDIVLHSNVCVEGGILKGLVKLRIRPRLSKESAVSISDGKLRIIGFEAIEDDHHEFFQHSAALSSIILSPLNIYKSSPPDPEGFSVAREGVHQLQFVLPLPLHGASRPKGPPPRSIWSFILAPAEQSIRATTSKSLFTGGLGKRVMGSLTLTAALHRRWFVAGTPISVNVSVQNDTKKFVKRLTLTLYRSTTVFKRKIRRGPGSSVADPESWQTTTTRKSVATSTLEMAQAFPRGHASTGGWWAGVPGGERSDFAHLLLIPPDALTHIRERLVEVEYAITVCLHAGSLTSDVAVTLPLQIVNFLSLDPPPTVLQPERDSPLDTPQAGGQDLAPISESDDEYRIGHEHDFSEFSSDSNDVEFPEQHTEEDPMGEAELGNLSLCEDTEDLVQHAIFSAQMDRCPEGTAQAIEENLYQMAEDPLEECAEELQDVEDPNASSKHESRPYRPCRPSSFAMRVQKMLEIAASTRQSLVAGDPSLQACVENSSEDPPTPTTNNPRLDVPSRSAISCDSGYQVASSSFLNDRYFASDSHHTSVTSRLLGSRVLPRPPSIAGLPFPETTPNLSCAQSPMTASPSSAVADDRATDFDLSDMSCSSASPKESKPKRPSIAPGMSSATSVKDKIRELEERVRAAEGY
ncbi:hypothetical protein DFH07DRAFT_1033153, partial [Mycena maculata]